MTFDPVEESRRAGFDVRTDPSYGLAQSRGFVRDGRLVIWWLPDLPDDSRPAIPGFDLGYRQQAWALSMREDTYEYEKFRQLLSASVLVFDTEAHAREYVDWLPTFALDRADNPAATPMEAAGKGAVLWRSGSSGHFIDVALIPSGTLVGEVLTSGVETDAYRGAIEPLALALAHRMAEVNPSARPYDAATVLAVPLPNDAWAALDGDRATYPDLMLCEEAVLTTCNGDVRMLEGQGRPEDSSALYLIDAQALNDEEREYPVVGSELIADADESKATEAMGTIVNDWPARDGGEQYPVPGIPGAVGVRTATLDDTEAVGYTWEATRLGAGA